MSDHRRKKRLGFTLWELLVVIAIIGVLIALLIPAIGGFSRASVTLSIDGGESESYSEKEVAELDLSEASELEISYSWGSIDLSPLGRWNNLERVHLLCQGRESHVEQLASLPNLTSLEIQYSEADGFLCLNTLTRLRELNIQSCDALRNLDSLSSLSSLETLEIGMCESLSDISGIASLQSLESLSIYSCPRIEDWSPLPSLTSLQSLKVFSCPGMNDISLCAGLPLESLTIDAGGKIEDLSSLREHTSLRELRLSGESQEWDLNVIATIDTLESLNLESSTKRLFDLSPLAGSPRLKSLTLTDRLGGMHWHNLSELTQLETLTLCVHERVLNLASLHSLSNITTLKLEYDVCDDLNPLGSLSNLETLEIDSQYPLAKMPPLPAIQQIKLHARDGRCNLFALAHLQDLESLDLSGNEKLVDLNPLASLQNLQTLNLCNCGSLNDLSPLYEMKGLRSININNCWRLEVDEIEKLKTALPNCEFAEEA